MSATNKPQPTEIKLHRVSRQLEVTYDDGSSFRLPAELLRVYSPSAEVRGHAPGQGVLPLGKVQVGINDVEAVGHYAVKLHFDDGHNTGLYTWEYLYELGANQQQLLADYRAAAAQQTPPTR